MEILVLLIVAVTLAIRTCVIEPKIDILDLALAAMTISVAVILLAESSQNNGVIEHCYKNTTYLEYNGGVTPAIINDHFVACE